MCPLRRNRSGLLELAGPNGAVRPGRLQSARIGRVERQRRPAVAVVEALDGVGLAVPARVVVPPARSRVVRRVAIRVVGEDVAGVVGDDVEDDVDPLLVGGLDEVAELLARPEMRIHVEEVLDAVAVVARLERDLPEERADPQGGDAEPPQVAELALQPAGASRPASRRRRGTRCRNRPGRGPRAGTAAWCRAVTGRSALSR